VSGLLGWMLDRLDAGDRRRAHDALRYTVTRHATDHGVVFGSAGWIVRAGTPMSVAP